MKLTLEGTSMDKGRSVVIQTKSDDLDIYNCWADVIEPALLAWGYSEKVIKRLEKEGGDD